MRSCCNAVIDHLIMRASVTQLTTLPNQILHSMRFVQLLPQSLHMPVSQLMLLHENCIQHDDRLALFHSIYIVLRGMNTSA